MATTSIIADGATELASSDFTLTAGEKLLCRQWAAEGNGVTVV